MHCKDYAVRQLSAAIDPTPFQFFDAQEAVTAYLHSHWSVLWQYKLYCYYGVIMMSSLHLLLLRFEEYQLFLKGDPDSADQENEEDKEEDQKPLVREHTVRLYRQLATCACTPVYTVRLEILVIEIFHEFRENYIIAKTLLLLFREISTITWAKWTSHAQFAKIFFMKFRK